MGRATAITASVFFGGALILALGAVLLFLGIPMSPPWFLVGGAALLASCGLVVQTVIREQAEQLSQRRSKVELLEAQLEQHRSAVDNLADGLEIAIFICDPKANIMYANRRAMELFRFDNPVGRTILAVTLSYDLEQLVVNAARLNTPHNAELTFTYPEDRTGLAKAWPQDAGQRVFLSVYDITDLRRLERIRRDFVSNVSHELRTPLMIIRSMAETLLEEPDTPAAKGGKYLEKVISEVDRLAAMSNDLLVLSSAESNIIEKQPCDVAEIFRNVVAQLTTKAAEKELEISYEGPSTLTIQANPEQIRQVAINLIDNAVSYTAKGSVTVSVRPEDADVVIRVTDTGIGIASDHLPRIFERFYRVDKARSRNIGGTGLGLSIVKHIVEAHGGRVAVQSALNEGTTFIIRLPAGSVNPTSAASPE